MANRVKTIIDYNILLLFIIFPLSFYSQVSYMKIPLNNQLVARNTDDKGIVLFEGKVDRTGCPDYQTIQIDIKRNGILYDSIIQVLDYVDDIASFSFNIEIEAELANYSFEVDAILDGIPSSVLPVGYGNDIVAGDVYIIQGQSNAVAKKRSGSSDDSIDSFIRVYANGTDQNDNLLNNNKWYIAQGDSYLNTDGNTGQWGLKLAKLIVDSESIPIAIFNGARGARWIDYFQKNYDESTKPTNNYERLLYRLDTTDLKNNVKAVFWSQGENLNNIYSIDDYYNAFISLKNSWLNDYPNIEKFYIFQTINGCNNYQGSTNFDRLMYTKEAQRKLASENTDINIMTVDELVQSSDDCHFNFINGYEEFAIRIFELVKRDLYGIDSGEIEPPNITDAYLTDETNLIIKTDASSLSMNNNANNNFQLENAGGVIIKHIEVIGSDIVFTLSDYPGSNASISNLGENPGINNNMIKSSISDLELLSFYQFPIDDSKFTIWDGNNWSNNVPNQTKYTTIEGGYSANDGNIEALNLKINGNLNFDNGTENSVIVYGDLTVNGNFAIGDKESLVMYDDSATIIGDITKNESSTPRYNTHDVTYWSSPIANAGIETVFAGVDPNRIFYFDQSLSTAIGSEPENDPEGNYWDVWTIASGHMNPGQGYAAEGVRESTGAHKISFTGTPNNGDIAIEIVFQDDNKDNDFNLIGNPYTCAINIDSLFSNNTSIIESTAYFWTHNTPISGGDHGDFVSADYVTYNLIGGVGGDKVPNNNIGSSQGFFVRAKGSGSVVFNNNMRMIDSNSQFYKRNNSKYTEKFNGSNEKNRIWLDLTTKEKGKDQLLIGFDKNATSGVDDGYDALKIDGGNPLSFYSVIKGEKYAIQGLSPFTEDKLVMLGFETAVVPRTFSISLSKTEGVLMDAEVYLIDHDLNIIHDLKIKDYKFKQMVAKENLNRFTLQFAGTSLLVGDITNKQAFFVTNKYNSLKVSSKRKVENIYIYDILGRIIINDNPNKRFFELKINNVKSGTILMIHAILENGSVIKRKFVKF